MSKGIVLVSGGMDSLVTAAIARKECSKLYFLHVGYGQRTAAKELACFNRICDFYLPDGKLKVDIDYLKLIGGSSLLEGSKFSSQLDKDNIPMTYVPFRNAHLISIAVSWAEVIKADRIYIGAVEEDSSGYPDCREEFYRALEKAVDLGTKNSTKIAIKTPVIHLTKPEIVKLGSELKAPFHLSWSCYQNQEQACGVCDSCRLRIKAFLGAGLKDPLEYEIEIDWNKEIKRK